MNNKYRPKWQVNQYVRDMDKMLSLIEKQHGGCDDENCSMRNLLDSVDSSEEEIIHWWACSGAACNVFSDLYEKNEVEIRKELNL
jgi:hypothetical protein